MKICSNSIKNETHNIMLTLDVKWVDDYMPKSQREWQELVQQEYDSLSQDDKQNEGEQR